MPYQNVYTPRIYLNIPEYLASTGAITIDPVYRTLPVSASTVTAPPNFPGLIGSSTSFSLTNSTGDSISYIALLGHTETDGISLEGATVVSGGIINGDFTNGVVPGFSIANLSAALTEITTVGDVGSILIGIYYDFPHSPDMNLSLEYSYEGIKETTTKGGATLTNAFYTKPPKWTDTLGAWELGGEPKYAKSGRRVWSLSWSYLSDSSVFPDNAGLVNETSTTDTTDSGETDLTLFKDDSFQRVIALTNGGQIPFLFQSNTTSGSVKPDSFAIAKFDMKSFKFSQVSMNTYNCKIRIKEVW